VHTIAVVGLGYVGLPLALAFASAEGCNVIGIDIDRKKIDKLNKGLSYFTHITSDSISNQISSGNFTVAYDFAQISEADAVALCVPTPLGKHNEPDTSYITGTIEALMPFLQKGTTLILESTTYPGTTTELIRNKIEKSTNYICGKDFFVVYSPEREDPGNESSNVKKIPKVISGETADCIQKGIFYYSKICSSLVPVSDTKIAESAKLLENIFRSVNIALMNEMKMIMSEMGLDIFDVIEAASTKPFGYMPFYPGPGLGGHCIPIDPFYLSWKAKEYGITARFIELAGEINSNMPDYVVSKAIEALNFCTKSIANSKVLILGLAYKKNVDDDRESPSYSLIRKLSRLQALVDYHDPLIPVVPITRDNQDLQGLASVEFTNDYDLYILATDHDVFAQYDFSKVKGAIVDTRGFFRNTSIEHTKA